jgi:16S rRNA (cytidine1402-2'-O)-methyltransferase
LLAKAGADNNIEMICLPGATALIPALWFQDFQITNFYLPDFYQKKGRQTKLKQLAEEKNNRSLRKSS